MKSPALIVKRNVIFKRAGALCAFIVKPVFSLNGNIDHFSQFNFVLNSLSFFRIGHFGFANWTRFFCSNFVKIVSNFSGVSENPKQINKPILKAIRPSNYFSNKANANGLHTVSKWSWGSVMGVFLAPSWHYLNHSLSTVSRRFK